MSLESFVAEIRDLARSIDPTLARHLGDEAPAPPLKRWRGDHRRGLELCLRMLCYARDELSASAADAAQFEQAIDYLRAALSATGGGGRSAAPSG